MKETFTSLRDFESSFKINMAKSKAAAGVLRAINHPLRQKMLQLIDSKKEMPVTQIYVTLRTEQSIASQQLGILRRAGIVKTRREGKQIFYSVDHTRIQEVEKYNTALIG